MSRPTTTPQPGLRAQWPGVCKRCEEPVSRGDRVVFQRGAYLHVRCASGADDG